MSAKSIREYHGKKILSQWMSKYSNNTHTVDDRLVQVNADVFAHSNQPFDDIAEKFPWVRDTKLVVKVDQLIKRRGKLGLIGVGLDWQGAQDWIVEHMNHEVAVEQVSGVLNSFLIEPFLPHTDDDEYYLCVQSNRFGDEFLFSTQGGIEVGDVDSHATRYQIPLSHEPSPEDFAEHLLQTAPDNRRQALSTFCYALHLLFKELNFVYLEINPLVMLGDDQVIPLDMAAKIDETASFINHAQWGNIDFPSPFGRPEMPEEAYIKDLDSRTGASLKLTILNPTGKVWTMVAGGGASVIYADTISDMGFGHELANYGEYSGAPSEGETYEYAKTILQLMTRGQPFEDGKTLIIGGGIANFTDVAATFAGIIRAIRTYAEELIAHKVSIWVRRAGPNYQEGLRQMRDVGIETNIPIRVYGPETHITAVVPLALGLHDPENVPEFDQSVDIVDKVTAERNEEAKEASEASEQQEEKTETSTTTSSSTEEKVEESSSSGSSDSSHSIMNFTSSTRCIVYGLQARAVQGMLDFDVMCKRERPSVACMVFPFSGNHYQKFYWGTSEVLIPVYKSTEEAVRKHSDATVLVNFASFRSVYSSMMDIFNHADQIKTVAIIAEGVPESQTRQIIHKAEELGVGLIGPATVGGIKPGCFRIGNTGGMLDNIVMSKLYRPGSVAYVSKSGGMSNELNNIICRNSDGVYEGVAIGGDRYPGSRFIDHLLRYQDNPEVKMMVLLGEVGGIDEYDIIQAIQDGRITKPLVAWCIGTCASIFPFEVQFGHAGALARGDMETSKAKNKALKEAGCYVPDSFNEIGASIKQVFNDLVSAGTIVVRPEVPVPKVPMDYNWAKRLGLIRKPSNFISTISDERGDELRYAGMSISEVFSNDIGVGGVLSLLWFQRRLPSYAAKFIEMILMVTADHGPAVSGAHNTIVAARAGKDLVSALASGLLTIGPRFGGALDEAARMFSKAHDEGISPAAFVRKMREESKLIMGIGHRVKSLDNPDMRVTIVKNFAKEHFQATPILDYALEVEQVTTKKKANLILNVDGCIAVCFVDMMRSCGAFTNEEAGELIDNGCLNGLFVLGRSIGFIGHFLDQKRLKQGLYRHPWDDISYINPEGL